MSYGWGLIEMCKTTLSMGRRGDTTKRTPLSTYCTNTMNLKMSQFEN